MYEGYRADPASVDERTRGFFERWSPPGHAAEDEGLPAAALDKALKVARLVEGIRSFGYAAARLDPLGSAAPLDPVLEADFHGLSEEDLEGLPAGLVVNGPLGERETVNVGEVIGTIGEADGAAPSNQKQSERKSNRRPRTLPARIRTGTGRSRTERTAPRPP